MSNINQHFYPNVHIQYPAIIENMPLPDEITYEDVQISQLEVDDAQMMEQALRHEDADFKTVEKPKAIPPTSKHADKETNMPTPKTTNLSTSKTRGTRLKRARPETQESARPQKKKKGNNDIVLNSEDDHDCEIMSTAGECFAEIRRLNDEADDNYKQSIALKMRLDQIVGHEIPKLLKAIKACKNYNPLTNSTHYQIGRGLHKRGRRKQKKLTPRELYWKRRRRLITKARKTLARSRSKQKHKSNRDSMRSDPASSSSTDTQRDGHSPEPQQVESPSNEVEYRPQQEDTSGEEDDGSPPVFAECVHRWQFTFPSYNTLRIGEVYRFRNLETVRSYAQVINALYTAIQGILDNLNQRIDPEDFVQVRLEASGLRNPLFSFKRSRDLFNAEEFLVQLSRLLQSNMEICAHGDFELVVTITKPPQGGARRKLSSIPASEIIARKRQYLIDLNYAGGNMCFAGALFGVMSLHKPTDSEMLTAAQKLHMELGWSDQKKVTLNDISTVEQHLRVNIDVAYYSKKSEWALFKTQGPIYPQAYTLLLHDEHFYGVLNVKALFGIRNYCQFCRKLYNHDHHSCLFYCRMCLRKGCDNVIGKQVRCPRCKFHCRSEACLKLHQQLGLEKKVKCLARMYCTKCRYYQELDHDDEKCKGRQCTVCWGYIVEDEGHLCYMQPLKQPKLSVKYLFYDFECHQSTGAHVPNFCFVKAYSGETVECFKPDFVEENSGSEDSDGEIEVEGEREPWKFAGKTWEFKGENCIEQFIKTFTKDGAFKDATFIAHNSKGYDCYFILRQLVKEKLDVEIIAQGGKLICVTVVGLSIKFIDSLSHLPMALSKLPKALGFEDAKGYFPHYFNKPENWDYVGPMPQPECYGVEYMMPAEKAAFTAWYAENQSKTFDMQKELAFYCQKDVEILEQACTKYRHEIVQLTMGIREVMVGKKKDKVKRYRVAIDPFQYPTIAGVALAMYRFKFLRVNTIAIPSCNDYHNQYKRFSSASIQWLSFVSHKEKVEIRHALNGGEVKVGNYFLDGFAVVDDKKVAYEYFGCFFHGCLICYSPEEDNPVVGKSYEFLFNATQKRTAELQSLGFEVRSIWEHEWRNMVKTDLEVQAYLAKASFPEPLKPRDALFGGRTNAICLYYKPKDGESVKYYDFTSLYPYVNKTKEYPLGHPEIIYKDFKPLSNYFGLVKAKVFPPRNLYFPVLPSRISGKLMFVLCSTCAEARHLDPCDHTDEERALIGTWCTIELNVAIEKGYKVVEIYEVWHFEHRSADLFSGYIKMHLRQKQEASGYPQWCVSKQDKSKYIRDYHAREGVRLRRNKIAVNPAKRQIAKLFLNSLWGKFGQRTNLPVTQVLRDPEDFFQILFSDAYKVSMSECLDDEAVCLSWKYSEDRVTTAGRKNEFIACFTTAYARLELYKLLDKLGSRVLYHDTDSVIFVSREGEWEPPLGDYLGDLTDEISSGRSITEFVSVGPKSYGYKLTDGTACLKVKGITLNSANCEKINFSSLKDLAFAYVSDKKGCQPREIVIHQPGIVRNKRQWTLHTKTLKKTQKVVFDKRVIKDGFTTLPYGY
ncbi:uncharacterized protein LOC134292300 [Anolis carolinensis]|uniref:uncharacterized protein LOC134296643 n=1 Tax=Anolis carolinensis TaxID=28377 RepID=UPI002F2B3AC5